MKPRTPGFWLIVTTVGLLGLTVLLSGCMHSIGARTAAPFESFVARADQGDARAQYLLASYYATGRGVVKDNVQAVKWYRKAAVQGNAQAQYSLGFHYVRSLGVPRDHGQALKWWLKAAEQGHADAQYMVGLCYGEGQGVRRDDVEAVKWHLKAADQGDVLAQNLIASRYFEGLGVRKDYAEAAKWWHRAADQGNADAQYRLAKCYNSGLGVRKDEVEALAYFIITGFDSENSELPMIKPTLQTVSRGPRRAEELRTEIEAKMAEAALRAQEEVYPALENHFPIPLPSSPEDSGANNMSARNVEYFNEIKAKADRGITGSYGTLADYYALGLGVAMDEVEAAKWYRKSADLGHEFSRLALGLYYFEGRGVAMDDIESYAFLNLAGVAGEIHGAEYLDALKYSLSPSERLRGRQRAKDLKKEADANIAARKAEDAKKARK